MSASEATARTGGNDGPDHRPERRAPERIVPRWTSWRRWSPGNRRLRGELAAFVGELPVRDRREGTAECSSWARVDELAGAATDQLERGQVSVGFESLNAARRVMLATKSIDELRAEAIALRAEAKDPKLSAWRRDAISTLVQSVADETMAPTVDRAVAEIVADQSSADTVADEGSEVELTRVRVSLAARLRDDGGQNTHRKNELVARRFWQLLAVTLAAVVLLTTLAWLSPLVLVSESSSDVADIALDHWNVWVYAFVLGVIGACVSAGLGLARGPFGGRVPEARAQTIPAVFRPVFGGAAAIGALTLLAAGLLPGLTVSVRTSLGVAFLAGFSERLIDAVATRVEPGP